MASIRYSAVKEDMLVHHGSCLCGAVRFAVDTDLKAPDACHCTQCRKQTGHFLVSTDVPKSAVQITGADAIRWYQSSEKVRRGFCATCGSPLFWDPPSRDWMGIAMGAFDGPTGTHVHVHIFVAEKGDYYDIADGVEQWDRVPVAPQ